VVYDGGFEKGLRSGRGKEFVMEKGKSICVYEGEFFGGENQGNGTQYSVNEKILYTGEFANGKRCGHGNLFNKDGKKIFVGEFQDGHNIGGGYGWLYSQANGSLLYEGEIKTLDINTTKALRQVNAV
jgi:antitoxin component YwqK of YwqJK toxin-antitoxin module